LLCILVTSPLGLALLVLFSFGNRSMKTFCLQSDRESCYPSFGPPFPSLNKVVYIISFVSSLFSPLFFLTPRLLADPSRYRVCFVAILRRFHDLDSSTPHPPPPPSPVASFYSFFTTYSISFSAIVHFLFLPRIDPGSQPLHSR